MLKKNVPATKPAAHINWLFKYKFLIKFNQNHSHLKQKGKRGKNEEVYQWKTKSAREENVKILGILCIYLEQEKLIYPLFFYQILYYDYIYHSLDICKSGFFRRRLEIKSLRYFQPYSSDSNINRSWKIHEDM